MSAPEETTENEAPQIVNLSQVTIESVQAELVRASQTRIRQLSAEEVELETSMAGGVQSTSFQARDSLIGGVAAEQASVHDSIVGGVRADNLELSGVTALAVANNMTIKEVNAIALLASDVHADSIHTTVLFSREVHGNVYASVDGRTALLAGVLAGSITGLILLAGKLLLGRKK